MKLWWAQLALNFLWTPVFFGAHRTGLALVVIVLMLAAILGFIATAWRLDRAAAWLFVPYAACVAFASVLNSSIWMLRRNMSRTRLLLEALLAAALTPEARDTFVGASANAQLVPTFAGDAARAAE
jgi:hypothetical protein